MKLARHLQVNNSSRLGYGGSAPGATPRLLRFIDSGLGQVVEGIYGL